ncbi:MAG: hypothetical protein KGL63_05835 [Betaproteobacteria bacterium]|nr:hypothetical protein [Betaproteobacteria bacterium]
MAVQTQLSRQGIMTPMPDDLPVQIYSAITGYVPGNAATDQGTDPEQLFAWWAANPIAGYKLGTFTRINPANVNAMRNAIINGGAYLCVELAVEQQGQKEWKPAGTPGSWGGHAVWADTYEADWLSVTSWGECILVDDAYLSGGFGAAVFSLDLEAT